MKILIDENLPLEFKNDFGEIHEVFSARDMNWHGKKNGELLGLMIEAGFEAFVTMDKNLPHQQDLTKFPIRIFILRGSNNKLETLQELIPILLDKIDKSFNRGVTEVRK